MKTSYFANLANVVNPLSISMMPPTFFVGNSFPELAPKASFLWAYKRGDIDAAGYTERFKELVLRPLDAQTVYDHLISTYGEDVTLLCFEKPGDFCHRRLVADWFKAEIGIEVPELIVPSKRLSLW